MRVCAGETEEDGKLGMNLTLNCQMRNAAENNTINTTAGTNTSLSYQQ